MKQLLLKLKNIISMKSLFESVTSVLTLNGIKYDINDEQNRIRFGISARNGNWQVVINIDEETRKLSFSSVCPIHTPDSRQTAMCELLNRMNDSIFMGRFSMDVEDGEIRFQTSAAFPESYLGDETVNWMFQSNVTTFDTYLPALIAVIYRHNEPALAFLETQQVEA
jgi:hypothetical protein